MGLKYIGHLPGAALNIGAQLGLTAGLQAYLGFLQGKLLSLQAQLAAMVNIDIPFPVDLALGLEAALAGVADISLQLPTATIDLNASLIADIGLLTIQVQLLAKMVAEFNLSLGASVHAWSWSGAAKAYGPSLTAALTNGLPDEAGPDQEVGGIVIACSDPASWANFGLTFKVG